MKWNTLISFKVTGGNGYNGGGGGRMSVIYTKNHYIGEYHSYGGTATLGGEIGAAGTVYLRDIGASPAATKIQIYNRDGTGVRADNLDFLHF